MVVVGIKLNLGTSNRYTKFNFLPCMIRKFLFCPDERDQSDTNRQTVAIRSLSSQRNVRDGQWHD